MMAVALADTSAAQLSRYVVHEHLGSGMTCDAFRVTCIDDDKTYVLKQMSLLSMTDEQKQRAKQEIDVMSNVNHPNVVRFRESFASAGAVSIIMECCEFGTLEQLIARQRSEGRLFADKVLLEWMAELLCALAHIHAKGIVHRDVKTSNIFVTAKNHLKLGDFGVCTVLSERATVATAMIGTPLYFAPEVCEYLPYDERCDVWSLGVVFYEMCTLRRPFVAHSLPQLMQRIVHDDVPPFAAGLDAQFEDVVRKMLSKRPQQRPTAQELIDKYLNVPASHPSHPSVKPALGRYKQSLYGPVLCFSASPPAPSTTTTGQPSQQAQQRGGAAAAVAGNASASEQQQQQSALPSGSLDESAMYDTMMTAAACTSEWLHTCDSLDLLAKLLQTSTLAAPRPTSSAAAAAATSAAHDDDDDDDDENDNDNNNGNDDDNDNTDDIVVKAVDGDGDGGAQQAAAVYDGAAADVDAPLLLYALNASTMSEQDPSPLRQPPLPTPTSSSATRTKTLASSTTLSRTRKRVTATTTPKRAGIAAAATTTTRKRDAGSTHGGGSSSTTAERRRTRPRRTTAQQQQQLKHSTTTATTATTATSSSAATPTTSHTRRTLRRSMRGASRTTTAAAPTATGAAAVAATSSMTDMLLTTTTTTAVSGDGAAMPSYNHTDTPAAASVYGSAHSSSRELRSSLMQSVRSALRVQRRRLFGDAVTDSDDDDDEEGVGDGDNNNNDVPSTVASARHDDKVDVDDSNGSPVTTALPPGSFALLDALRDRAHAPHPITARSSTSGSSRTSRGAAHTSTAPSNSLLVDVAALLERWSTQPQRGEAAVEALNAAIALMNTYKQTAAAAVAASAATATSSSTV